MRWVITEKSEEGKSVTKARLVARGYEECNLKNVRTDSPTCKRENLRIILAVNASKSWNVHSLDIKSAFLQGKDIGRDVFLKTPIEVRNGNLWKLKTTVYGLCDAPRVWYLTVSKEILNTGCKKSMYDDAIFFWHFKEILNGVLCCHVDDFFWGGTDLFQRNVVDAIKNTFTVSKEFHQSFKFLGLNINDRKGGISMHQQQYINEIEEIKIDAQRKYMKDLLPDEARQLRGLAGQLNWAASQTRPDLAYGACVISTSVKHARISDIITANKFVKKLKANAVVLQFFCIKDFEKADIICFSDASLGNLRDGGSQGGCIIFLCKDSNVIPIGWQSKKIRRVVKSTLAAETLAMEEACEMAIMIRCIFCELLNLDNTDMDVLKIKCKTDNKSLVDSVYSTKT